MDTELLLNKVDEAQVLSVFKRICDLYSDYDKKNNLRNIIAISPDKHETIKQIAKRNSEISINDNQVDRLVELVKAFLRKSEYRKIISVETREKLLLNQKFKCIYCGKEIDYTAHADHIVPFKYVGDELNSNLQMLCSNCNEKKSDRIDYQIRFLLNLV